VRGAIHIARRIGTYPHIHLGAKIRNANQIAPPQPYVNEFVTCVKLRASGIGTLHQSLPQ
jgi:hypothetical protein